MKKHMQTLFALLLTLALLLAACAPAPTAAPQTSTSTPAMQSTVVGEESVDTPEISAVVPETADTAPQTGGSLARALTTEPPSLDPAGVAGSGQNVILPYLFDTLVYSDIDNTIKPYLAQSWEFSDDGLTLAMKLRPGVTFHDGTPLDAEAVVFTFERARAEGSQSPMASALSVVDAIEAPSADEVVFRLSQPSSTLLSSLTTAYAGIVSPTAVTAAGADFGMNPVGSGPFQLESWQPGQSITLVRNENYAWGPDVLQNPAAPRLDSLVFKIIPDAAMQLTAFQTGEIDVMYLNQMRLLAQIQQDPNAHVEETTLKGLVYLGYNNAAAPFTDPLVRRAIAQAIDKEEVLALALGGVGETAFSPLASTIAGFDPSLKDLEPPYDPAQAQALLEEAGFTRQDDGSWLDAEGQPFTLRLLTSTRPPNENVAAVIQEQLARIGIPVEIQALDSNAATEAATAGEYQMMLWRYDWNDADVLNTYLSSSRMGRTNRSFYSNPDLDELLAQAAAEQDPAARAELYSQAQAILIADQPWVPLYTPKDYIITRATVHDIVYGVMGRLLLNDAWIEK